MSTFPPTSSPQAPESGCPDRPSSRSLVRSQRRSADRYLPRGRRRRRSARAIRGCRPLPIARCQGQPPAREFSGGRVFRASLKPPKENAPRPRPRGERAPLRSRDTPGGRANGIVVDSPACHTAEISEAHATGNLRQAASRDRQPCDGASRSPLQPALRRRSTSSTAARRRTSRTAGSASSRRARHTAGRR